MGSTFLTQAPAQQKPRGQHATKTGDREEEAFATSDSQVMSLEITNEQQLYSKSIQKTLVKHLG